MSSPAAPSTGSAIAARAGDSDEVLAAAALLAGALDEARIAVENDAPEGAALIDGVHATLSAQDTAAPFMPAVRMRLAQIFAQAGLEPPACARLTLDAMEDLAEDDAVPPDASDIAAALDGLIGEAGGKLLQAHAALGEILAGLPSEVGAMLVATIIAQPGTPKAWLGLYWLLDRQPHMRHAAALALLQRSEAGALAPDVGAVLPTIRKWLPADPARDALDAAIRGLIRNSAGRSAGKAPIVERAAASLPDGVGAQSLMAAVRAGRKRSLAMIMVKQGHGVKDAGIVIPCPCAASRAACSLSMPPRIEMVDIGDRASRWFGCPFRTR